MGQLQSNDEIYSVLYVDFDNMYTRLAEQDIGLAKIFATSPHKWMRWIDGHAIRMMYGDGIRRRILKRVCYMNSVRYAEFKPFFVRSGFIVQDCIPAFNQSKSNVDILLTMNCLDDLQHVTRYDEFIILSADSDFTPLIFRINENARRSIVLSVGHTAPAYASACSWRIREDWFLTQALEESREDGDETHDRFEHGSKSIERRAEPRNRPNYEIGAKDVAPKGNAVTISVYQRMKLVEAIKQLVAESNAPVPLPSLAQVLQTELDGASDWFGAGTLRSLIDSLDIRPLKFSPADQGFIYDQERHTKPEIGSGHNVFERTNPELFNFAYNVHKHVAVPLLMPTHYAQLLGIIASEINADGFSDHTAKHVEERCHEENLPVNTQQVAFILDAIRQGGQELKKGIGAVSEEQLREALIKRVGVLCKGSNLKFGHTEQKFIENWLGETA